MQLTVNAAIELVNTLRGRVSDLQTLRNQNAVRERLFRNEERTEKEPLYNPVDVDKKIVEIKNAIRKLNSAIKESNAKTKLPEFPQAEINENSLLAPVEAMPGATRNS